MAKEEALKVAENEEKETAVSGAEIEKKIEETLEKLILDTTFNKYDAVLLARRWAYELKAKEGETRSLQDLIAVAIRDILDTRVSHKMVRELPILKTGGKKAKSAQILENLQKIESETKEPSKKSKK